MKKFVKKILPILLCYTAIFLLIVGSKSVSSGVKSGIDTCVTLVIPSLFIFMVLSNFVVSSPLCNILATPFKPISRLLQIDGGLMSIVILSLVGGYPIGARMIAQKVRHGEITPQTGENLLCYCVNCGPAFLISGVGISILGNAKVGIIIYLSQVVACLCVGILLRGKVACSKSSVSSYQSNSVLFVGAVSDSVKAMGTVCGLIVCFSAVVSLLNGRVGDILPYLNGVLEVTTAIRPLTAVPNSIVIIAVFTAFGGLCVHTQLAAMLYKTGVKLGKFYIYRTIYCSISGIIVFVYLQLTPDPKSCIKIASEITPLQTAPTTATFFLILLSIMLLFFTKKFDRIEV